MERAEARRLQPHYIESFFRQAFTHLGGQIHPRENGRFEITRVPGAIRERDRAIGRSEPVLERYERVCFEKNLISGPPVAAYLCPGHPLLDATIDLVLERYRDLLKCGAVLVNDADDSDDIRALFYLQHAVQDGRQTRGGEQQIISERMQFVEVDAKGQVRDGGPAPYLDYRPITTAEKELVSDRLKAAWLSRNLEGEVMAYAITELAPAHVQEVRDRRLAEIAKVESEVIARLKKEINYWDHRAEDLKAQERAGKAGGRLNATQAANRANELADRLQRRLAELSRERDISARPPAVKGGALVVPGGLLRRLTLPTSTQPSQLSDNSASRAEIELLAMQAVIDAEKALGHLPRDVSAERIGYDIESKNAATGHLRFIEVKGRIEGADTVTITRNEILTALNKPEAFILAIVSVADGFVHEPRYVRTPFKREPDFGATSVTYQIAELMRTAGSPS
jgi:hypothetical protein